MGTVIRPGQYRVGSEFDAARRIAENPVGYLKAHHYTQMALCLLLERLPLVPDPPSASAAADAETILMYLVGELPHHQKDEEDDLYTLVREASPSSGIVSMMARLRFHHLEDRRLLEPLLEDLAAISLRCAPRWPRRFARNAGGFARSWYEHLRWEEAELLPQLIHVLDENDRLSLAQGMKARRRLNDEFG